MSNFSRRTSLKNIAAARPTRKHMGPDGVVVTEKLNPIPFSRKMISPDGNVVTISLATGFHSRSFVGNDYGVMKWAEKLKAGFLPFSECPVATGYIPGDSACADKFTDAKCCPHLDNVIQARRSAYRKVQMERDAKYNAGANQDRMLALFEKWMNENKAPDGARKGMPK